MIRVNVVAEGQSELYFVKKIFCTYPYQKGINILIESRAVQTSKDNKTGHSFRGGMDDYLKPKHDIIQWLKESSDTYITTMFDFYGLPEKFPGYHEAMVQSDPYMAISILERELKRDILHDLPDINPERFIPYIQLHEFEALIFSDLEKLKEIYLGKENALKIDGLIRDVKGMKPELINNGFETAPSKRLQHTIPYRKGASVVLVMQEIGIEKMLESCPHFSEWVNQLMKLH